MITQTAFAVSDDQTRFQMSGVYFEKDEDKIVMVATDGKRLSYASKFLTNAVPDFTGVIIPVKILLIIQKRFSDEGNISVKVTDNTVFFTFGLYNLSSQLIEGQFPNYKRVIPEDLQFAATFGKDDMFSAMKRVSIIMDKDNKNLSLGLKKGSVSVYIEEGEAGEAEEAFDCEYEYEDNELTVQMRYLEDPIKALDTDKFKIMFTDTSKAIMLCPVPEKDYFHIMMPKQR
jgi:DNA polymerase-3 subunit beta